MRNFMLQKATFQCWRLFQTLLVTAILCLEIAQLNAFRPWYYEEPSHGNASYFGLVIFITLASLLYFLSSFSYRWITGPYKHEIYADLFLAHLWTIVSLMNIIPSLNGGTLTCKYPEDENHYARITRCHLFLSSMSLGWIVAVTYMVASYVSIMRWNKRPIEAIPPKLVEPPVVLHKPETYLVQKGVLADGQPALIFHMAQKNNSTPNLSAKGTKSGHSSGNVTPTTSSHNGSASNLQNFTLQQTNVSRTSIYLHDKVVKP